MAEGSPIQPEDPTWNDFATDDMLQLFALYLDQPLVAGAVYVITLDYTADLIDPAVAYGMYWDSYTHSNGEVRYVLLKLKS